MMQSSGGPSPLPAAPLPPSPYQQTYSPETGLTFTPAAAGAPPAAPTPPRKGPPKAAAAVFVIVFVVVILVFSGALDGLLSPSGASSNQPNVKVTNTSASHVCPYSGTPTETYLFTLVNSGTTDAVASIGFYLNDAQVKSGTYSAPAGTSTPYTVTAPLSSCPPSGSTYYLELLSVASA
jgi:hypothetical protein